RLVLHDEGVLPVGGLHVVHEAVVAFLPAQPVDGDRLTSSNGRLDHLRDGAKVVIQRGQDRIVGDQQAAHGVGLTLGEASAFGGDGVGQAAHDCLAVINQPVPLLSTVRAAFCVVRSTVAAPLIVPVAV